MKISVTNLGAIKQATIELGGLTVFVGPNGTGKSYLAKVIYGLQGIDTVIANFNNGKAEDFYQIIFGKNMGNAQEVLQDLQQLTPVALQRVLPIFFNKYAELFKNTLGEYFNDDSNLFAHTTISYIEINDLSAKRLQDIINDSIELVESEVSSSYGDVATQLLVGLYFGLYLSLGVGSAIYFPAARSNFMLTYKALYRARADEHVGMDALSPRFLGNNTRKSGGLIRFDKPTEDFIRRLYDLDSSQQLLYADVAVKLQKLLYGNDQFLVEQPEGALPDFRYQVNNAPNKIRLHLTSSMVTETSPIFMGFKYWIQPNSLVIIDEPESHLHPEAQQQLINVLAEAVNQGIRIILITHSPYILSCINNLIKLNIISKNYPDDVNLTQLKQQYCGLVALEKPVTAYHFGSDGTVKSIVRDSGLIDEAEFTEPFDEINALYEAMRDIEWEHR